MDITEGLDIPSVSTYMAQSNVQSAVGTSVLSMTLDDNKEMGGCTYKMMEQSVNPNIGSNIDISL